MIPRSEYPRPQMVRNEWVCLNGKWEFEIDKGNSGLERGLLTKPLSSEITVPFCPESTLSGVCDTDFLNAVWYRRKVSIPPEWAGRRVNLIFQAVDYDATIWVDGEMLSRHRGGFTPITVELPERLSGGDNFTVVVRARDEVKPEKPVGKQSGKFGNYGCRYTRTTGIWQSVWMEPVSRRAYFLRPRITPDLTNSRFRLVLPIRRDRPGLSVEAEISDGDGVITSRRVAIKDFQPCLDLEIPSERLRLWEVGRGSLYDISLRLLDGKEVIDEISCYAGMRSVSIDGKAIKINDKTVFQRLVLDQGYYEDGIMTAPTEQELIRDIELSLQAGFNGARLHQKVFEERFLYHADRLGYLVWGEFSDWTDPRICGDSQTTPTWITQWLEVLQRDYNHPSIIGWCPMNETAELLEDRISNLDETQMGMFLATKAMDQTRPVLDSSGYSHRVPITDVWDCHDYEQDPEVFASHYLDISPGGIFENGKDENNGWNLDAYQGLPFF